MVKMFLQIALLEQTLFLQTGLPEHILWALTDFVGRTLIAPTELLKQTLFLQASLPKEILLVLMDFLNEH